METNERKEKRVRFLVLTPAYRQDVAGVKSKSVSDQTYRKQCHISDIAKKNPARRVPENRENHNVYMPPPFLHLCPPRVFGPFGPDLSCWGQVFIFLLHASAWGLFSKCILCAREANCRTCHPWQSRCRGWIGASERSSWFVAGIWVLGFQRSKEHRVQNLGDF